MSKPVHGRGTAAEQGAAIRQQMQEKEQKRLSTLNQSTGRSHRNSYRPPPQSSTASPRAVPPTHVSQGAATPPPSSPRKVSKRSNEGSQRRRSRQVDQRSAATQDDSEDGTRAKRGSRALRQKADGKSSDPKKTPVADASPDEAAVEEKENGTSRKKSTKKKTAAAGGAAAAGTLGAAAAAGKEGRRHNYAAKQSEQGPVYADEDGQDLPATSQSGAVEDHDNASSSADSETGAAVAGAGAGATANRQSVPLEQKGRVYPLTGIDNVALLMEDAGYQTACFSVYLFKTVLDYDTVRDFFERLAQAYPKYRYVCELDPAAASKKDKAARKGQPIKSSGFDKGRVTRYSKSLKAGGPFRPARWRIDESFDLQENITVKKASGAGDDETLFGICGEVLSNHFDFSKPLWEATLVQGLNTSEGARSALMIKIHHAFSDGQGMIQSYHSAIEAMQAGVSIAEKQTEFDTKAVQASKNKSKSDAEKKDAHPEQKKIGSRNIKPTMGGTISHSWHTIRGLYFRRREEFNYSDAEAKRSVKQNGGEISKNCRPSRRLYAHSDGIAMDDIKLVRQAFSTDKVNLTLNDVASAILSRALRIAAEEVARQSGRKVRDQRVAVFIPISKRPKGDWTLANYTTGAIAWFRFHNPSNYGFEQLLHQVHREMNRIKRSYLPQWWFSWFNAICKRRAFQLPNYPLFRQIFQAAYREYHVFTNLPGPAKPVKFGDHEAFSYHVLPPSSPGRSTMAIGTISYAHDFSLAVSCDDTNSFREKQLTRVICKAFQEASEELVAAAKERIKTE